MGFRTDRLKKEGGELNPQNFENLQNGEAWQMILLEFNKSMESYEE